MGVTYQRHGTSIYKTAQWKALRMAARRRDGFACTGCGARGRLEVDHKLPLRTHPELAFDLGNLQCLCPACHSRKTRIEVGHPELSPERLAWRRLLKGPIKNAAKSIEQNEVSNA